MENRLLLSAVVFMGVNAILCCALIGVIIKSLDVSGTGCDAKVEQSEAEKL